MVGRIAETSDAGRREGDPHLGWYDRGYLPHRDEVGLIQHVVFGLMDALPPGANTQDSGTDLDRGWGACWLGTGEVAGAVERAVRFFDQERYELMALVIMPNHVHVVFRMVEGWPLGKLVESWKTFSAKEANRLLGRKGKFWARGYFDRYVRDGEHLKTLIRYVEENPVKAELVGEAAQWKWGSAWHVEKGWRRPVGFGRMGSGCRPQCGGPSVGEAVGGSEREGGIDV